MEIKLGSTVKDTVTGFGGVATARAVYLYGQPQVLVESKDLHEGKPVSEWFNEDRLEVIEE